MTIFKHRQTEKGNGGGHSANPRDDSGAVKDPEQYTLRKWPWRIRTTSFQRILQENYRGDGTAEHPYIVSWLANDPENPRAFGLRHKWAITAVNAATTLAVALASSAYAGAALDITISFRERSEEVVILGISLFVLGFAAGPLVWGPLSEVYGRRWILIGTYFMFTLWNAVAAASPNIGSYIVFRCLAGIFGSSPLANAGGTISDIFDAKTRGLAAGLFAAALILGPALGPTIGGFLSQTEGWAWVQGFLGFFSGVLTFLAWLTVPETYAPTLLRRRAARLSKVTGQHYTAQADADKKIDFAWLRTQLTRPWLLLFQEPIVFVMSIYMAIVYGTLYMLFAAFPIIFQEGRGWSAGISGLAFMGMFVGMLIGLIWSLLVSEPQYAKASRKYDGNPPPEARLPPSLIDGPCLVIGLAWFAASCGPDTFWIVCIIGTAPVGIGMVLIFLPLTLYLIDVYTVYSASVLAATSVLRSLFGVAFPLFTTYMYRDLGVHWASAVPGFLALGCLPFPYLFYRYGGALRKRCKWTVKAARLYAATNAIGPDGDVNSSPSGSQMSDLHPQLSHHTKEAENHERAVQRAEEKGRLGARNGNRADAGVQPRNGTLSNTEVVEDRV
ncbi:putative mfs-multidrug-resistance transporter [Cystobasidium minutum MCA 4210]|uniref:putative mfs-multidrug-resistance transporter n=1 Tax=Cystobasidium minutum MCA 4210 TaxID=1397322 RepID=UPI0034CF3984|eukprot:jgi/Rhomi1/172939/fgenesh1_kg.5_\